MSTTTETKSSTTSTTQKSKTPVQDIMEMMLQEIDMAEKDPSMDPMQREARLRDISRLHKKILTESWIRTKMKIGYWKFEKRAKRRATRKPLTFRKARSLANDLYQLARIFNV